MSALHEMLAAFLDRVIGSTDLDVVAAALGQPWVRRGVSNAELRLRMTSSDDIELKAVWALSYEAGALHALHLTCTVLSDPACKGREHEALKLVEEGLGHAAIIAALRAPRGDQAGLDATVVAFPSKGGRA